MTGICFYFQIHQPFRIKRFTVFDIGNRDDYFDEKKNEEIMKRIAKKCYLPMNWLLLKQINRFKGQFKVAFSITGNALEQFKMYAPEIIKSFQDLAKTGCVEFLGETYYHSLASFHSKAEFKEQAILHKNKIKSLFGQYPKVFRNTELIFHNDLLPTIQELGYSAILTEGTHSVLGKRSPNYVYSIKGNEKVKLLLRNYKLSDDIAFRFSNKDWEEWPLSVRTFANWLDDQGKNSDVINLFMDYETFGEHQTKDTGIMGFIEKLPREILRQKNLNFVKPSEAVLKNKPKEELYIPIPVSWADQERDLSAWMGNKMQNAAIKSVYLMENDIKAMNDAELLHKWRIMQGSDHFYYMCTKYFEDGDVHKYFNPYDSPYESFIAYMNIINDMMVRIKTNQKAINEPKNNVNQTIVQQAS